jgi:uncharacterized protein YjbI with pentapeptide repeats/adenylate kinase family enzyme
MNMSNKLLKISRPTPILKKTLKINIKEFTKALGKSGTSLVFGKWEGLAGGVVDLISSLGLKSDANEMAWLLLYRGFLRAIRQIVEEVLQINLDENDVKSLHQLVVDGLLKTPIILDRKFLSLPQESALTEAIAEEFANWLKNQGIRELDAISTSKRLRSYIASSLHDEWATSSLEYGVLKNRIDTPFTQATEREFGWLRYNAWLKKQTELPMFLESFSLSQIYIPLRGYFNVKTESANGPGRRLDEAPSSQTVRVVVNIADELDKWINAADKNDAIRLISGGPGSGKSSFAKMFAAKRSIITEVPILFIPLHHFEPSSDLIEAIGKFVKIENFLSANPIDLENADSRLLVIFDGLDELALQGKIGERTAQEFIREVILKVEQLNQRRLRVQVIVTGRELVIQSNETYFRREGQILFVLPYCMPEGILLESYSDPQKILEIDQRQEWWEKYGNVSGSKFTGLPVELAKKNLAEITSQPLLNYLVALAFKHGKVKFSSLVNLNAIYADLLRAIYERGWATKQHAAIQGLEEQEFTRILEEIALASWHGDGRTTTIKDIEAHCVSGGLQGLLDKFQRGMESDPRSRVTQLLTAFYFRQNGQNIVGDRTFEFTHKSFGEYLTARRLIREMGLIHRKLQQHDTDSDDGWSVREALHRWLLIAGQTPIDNYIFSFILGEIEFTGVDAAAWQKTFCRLIDFELQNGMPAELLSPRLSHLKETSMVRNAEESLFLVLNACAQKSKKISNIRWKDNLSFGNAIARMAGQRNFDYAMIFRCLSYLNLHKCVLTNRDFWSANFENSDLSYAKLVGVDARYSKFNNADLRGSIMLFGNFSGADFSGAKLGSSDVKKRAELVGSIDEVPENVNENCWLYSSDFSNSDLEGVAFIGLDVRGVSFSDANLKNAIFSAAKITPEQETFLQTLGANVENSIIIPVDEDADRIVYDRVGYDEFDLDEEI